jgi:leucyl/phenylalanyl-tRNA--protein transferase
VCLVHLVARLRRGGYRLLDAQFVTRHLQSFGAIEIDRALYQTLLAEALQREPGDDAWSGPLAGDEAVRLAR